nr:transcriptional regulator [Schwartzia sp. (in: firmicutes)]
MEELLYLTELFDLYGPLLIERQRRWMEMHLLEDFSLAEIGEELGISRQAVHDNLHRSQKAMEAYEERLGLAKRHREERAGLAGVYGMVEKLRQPGNERAVDEILERLSPFLETGLEVSN